MDMKQLFTELRNLSDAELRAYAKYVYLLKTDRPAAQKFYNHLFGEKEETASTD